MMRRIGWILPIVLAVVLLPMGVLAQEHGASHSGGSGGGEMMKGHHQGQGMMHSKMMEECMAKKKEATTDLDAMDEKLNAKVAVMNTAKGEARSEAMAAVINEMVAQRKEMRSKLTDMHDAKMCGMMKSMGHGGMHKGKQMEMDHGAHEGHGDGMKKEGAAQ